jgi:hypothetical protein
MLNLSQLFYCENSDEKTSFYKAICPTKEQEAFLRKSKNEIKDYLKPRIKKATRTVLGMNKEVEPRFRTQGSWDYRTCVQPAHPSQEIDWDFGMYLPVTVWEDLGPPAAMAKRYFDLVEGFLNGLCRREGWEFISEKETCIRIKVSDWAHIDVPLYAVPEKEFESITESLALEKRHVFDSRDHLRFDDFKEIRMATRDGQWKKSDPKKVSDWFKNEIKEHKNGDQLRRICRYLKVWRDFHWKTGGPSSISIMIAACQCFSEDKNRDDLELHAISKTLSQTFISDIQEEGIDGGDENFNRLSNEERQIASKKLLELHNCLDVALNSRKEECLNILAGQFGKRILLDVELISEDSNHEKDWISSLVRNEVIGSIPADFHKGFSHVKNPPWKWAQKGYQIGKVTITADLYDTNKSLIEKNVPPKLFESGQSLDFSVRGNGFRSDRHQVQWRVTNTGIAAKQVGGLRGDFYGASQSGERKEHLQYRGVHFVEAFVLDKETKKIVAKSDPFYVPIR